MTPISPVVVGQEHNEIVFAKDQPEYTPLHVLMLKGDTRAVVSRWRLSVDDLIAINNGADIVLTQLTFGHPLQPVNFQIVPPDGVPEVTS